MLNGDMGENVCPVAFEVAQSATLIHIRGNLRNTPRGRAIPLSQLGGNERNIGRQKGHHHET